MYTQPLSSPPSALSSLLLALRTPLLALCPPLIFFFRSYDISPFLTLMVVEEFFLKPKKPLK